MYITHELEHHKGHQEGHCLICLEIQLAGHLTKQLATAGNQVVPAVLMIVTAGFFSTTLPCYRLERNLITDKVRMDR